MPSFLSSLVEDDSPQAPPVKPEVKQEVNQPMVQLASAVMPSGSLPAAECDHADESYQRLLSKTDTSTSPVFQAINKHLAPIASLALDDRTKFKIALQQAQALDGIQGNAVLDVFTQMNAVLKYEADRFSQTIVKATTEKVDGPKSKAAEISEQIKQLQAQVAQLTEQSFTAQQKIQGVQHQFDVALATRTNELNQEQAKYASLLGA